ncbi:MAG: ATP-binding protein [Planctomycetes bacterium]|nr:ATP-binding protein [Planctomycetota bacterium]
MTPGCKRQGGNSGILYSVSTPRTFGRVLLEERISSRLRHKNKVIKKILQRAEAEKCITEDEKGRWRLCLDEAMVNAIVHGNNGDPRRFVRVTLMAGESRWAVLVEDEGEGFDPEDIPDAGSLRALYAESGRGILLMKEFTDEVRFYRRGASVMLVKSRTKPRGTGKSSGGASKRRKHGSQGT